MAVVQTEKAVNLARALVVHCDALMNALDQINAIKSEKESSGVNFADAANEAAYAALTDLKHVDGTVLNNVLTSGAAILAWMVAEFHDDNIQKARA